VSVGAPPQAGTAPNEPAERCPLCGESLAKEQEWCLRCGAAARTRLAATPRWRPPVVGLVAAIVLSLGALSAALVSLAGSSAKHGVVAVTRTVTVPAGAAPASTVPSAAGTATGAGAAGTGAGAASTPAHTGTAAGTASGAATGTTNATTPGAAANGSAGKGAAGATGTTPAGGGAKATGTPSGGSSTAAQGTSSTPATSGAAGSGAAKKSNGMEKLIEEYERRHG
jgi:hypothetical protein